MKKYFINFLLFCWSVPIFSQAGEGRATTMYDAMENAGIKRVGSGMGIGGYFIILILFLIGITVWVHFDKYGKK